MRALPPVAIAALLGLPGCRQEAQQDAAAPDPTPQCREVVKAFATQLQSELKSALAAGGPVEAISVCKDKAPAIASRLSEEDGWEIGRTSLKIRNPQNAPDAWERRQLEAFDQKAAEGADPATLEVSTMARDSFRYMKAIPVQGTCLLCHGETIAPPVAAALDSAYPGDKARGYQVGQLRGAFTITIPPDSLEQ